MENSIYVKSLPLRGTLAKENGEINPWTKPTQNHRQELTT